MGLDMYLQKSPKIEGCTLRDVEIIEGYFDWKRAKAEDSEYAKYTLEQWCGTPYKDVNRKAIKLLEPYFKHQYGAWDRECKYGYDSIFEEVGYWRKANAIHVWFVKNVQDGKDDCQSYEVSREQLMKLYLICKTIITESILEPGKIVIGQQLNKNGEWENIYEDGYIITNPEIAAKLLPTRSGFFFGSTNYYVDSYLSPSIYYADCGWNHCRYHVFSNAYGTEEYIGLYPNETSTSGRYINVTATSLGGIAETVWNNIFN